MIDTVIFDLGGVLVDFRPYEGMEKLGFDEKTINTFKEKIFSGVWEECDRFPYEDNEIRDLFKKHIPEYSREVDILWDNISVITAVNDYSEEWLRSLKEKGLKLYILSNYGKQSFKINSKKYGFLRYVDGRVISYEYEYLKPEPQLYEELLKKYNINRETAVFIDDRKENVEGALKVGLNALVFENFDSTNIKLMEMISE